MQPGFGERLKEERERIGLSQHAFAEAAGIKRLSQINYEKEKTIPSISYLAEIQKLGVELNYLLFGKHPSAIPLPTSQGRKLEKRIFDEIEKYVAESCGGELSADERYVLYDMLRSRFLFSIEQSSDIDPLDIDIKLA